MTKLYNNYLRPEIDEVLVKVEAGFALSDSILEGIPETDPDGGF